MGKLERNLVALEQNNKDILFITQQGINLCKETLEQLRDLAIKNTQVTPKLGILKRILHS